MKHFVLALLISMTFSGLNPGTANAAPALTPAAGGSQISAAPPPQDLARPRVMQEAFAQSLSAAPPASEPLLPQQKLATPSAAALGVGGGGSAATNSGLQREVFGFVNAGNLGDPTFGYQSWQFQLLTTVAFFGLQVNSGDGNLVRTGTPWTVWNSSTMSNLIATAHANGTKVVLSIILQDFAAGTPQMCAGLTHTATTIQQTVAEVQAHGVDGVNVDYEGLNGSCGTTDPNTARRLMTSFIQQLRAAMPGRDLSVATYAASAGDPNNFFDIPTLAGSVDSFFVMAYDSDFSNYTHLGCSEYCLSPVSPTSGYYYNDTRAAGEYAAVVPSSKVILGLPYYGRKACVSGTGPNLVPLSPTTFSSPTYYYASTTAQTDGVSAFVAHQDPHDGTEEYDTWQSSTYACAREQYWENAGSLGAKYDVVNRFDLRGAGIFTLDYGGAASELWNQLSSHFTQIPGTPTNVIADPGNGFATVRWQAPPSSSPITGYTISASPGGSSISAPATANQATVPGLANGTIYTFVVRASSAQGSGHNSAPSNAVTPSPPAGSYPARYHALPPTRAYDTRLGMNGFSRIGAGSPVSLGILGIAGVPTTNVSAVVLNVTVTGATNPSFLSVLPTGADPTAVSNLNFGPGATAAALVETNLGADGRFQIYNEAGSTDVAIDVFGYVSGTADAGPGGVFVPLTPSRIMDTRLSLPGLGRLQPGHQTITLDTLGRGGIPSTGVAGLVLNITTTNSTVSSYLSVYQADLGASPGTSNINFGPGETVANRAFVKLGSSGQLDVYNAAGATDAIIDVTGYFTDSTVTGGGGGLYTASTPVRVLDTRTGMGAPAARLGPAATLTLNVNGLPGLPTSGIGAVLISLTATNATQPSFLAVSPTAGPPTTSDVNFGSGQTVANLVVAWPAPDGTIRIYNAAGATDVIVDISGWYGA